MNGGDRVVSLQLLRFVAATMVVWHHSISLAVGCWGTAGVLGSARLFGLGGTGIDIFFVISGFVISLSGPLATRRPSAAVFYLRRWARIAPLFWILTIPTVLTWQFMTPVSPWGAGYPASLNQVVATIFFWPSIGVINVPPFLSNGWTLCFEMLFYSVMSIILLGGRIRLMSGLVLAAVAVATVLRSRFDVPVLQFIDNKICLEFCMGVALAIFRKEIAAIGVRWGLLLLGIGALWLILWGLGAGPDVAGYDQIMADEGVMLRVLVIGVPAAMVVAGTIALDGVIVRQRALFDRLGDASYAIFLSHGLTLLAIYLIFVVARSASPPWLLIVGGVGLSVWIGYMWYGAFDRPIMAFFRGRIRSPAVTPLPAPAV